MKRLSILLAAATLLAAIAGCQKEPVGGNEAEHTNSYVSFTINFNSDVTKADYADGNTSDPTPAEHDVKTAYLYFFKDNKYVSTITISAEDITSATLVSGTPVKKTTVPTLLDAATYNVYATLNYEVTSLSTETTTEDIFKENTCSFAPTSFDVEKSGVPMSSRSSDGVMCASVTLTSANTKDNPLEFSLDMERMIAKIQAKKSASYTIYEDRAETGTAVATASITGYKPVNLTKTAYIFRHVSPTGFGAVAGTTEATNYVVEPTTSSKTATAAPFPELDYENKVGGEEKYTAWTDNDKFTHVTYCAENTMPTAETQLTNYATALAFTAALTPAENKYYADADDAGAGEYKAGDDLWYYNDCFYASLDVLNSVNGLTLTESNYGKFGVKKFVGGLCYYTYYISHFSNSDPEKMALMEYAIVRNNDYQVTVTKIKAVGNDVDDIIDQGVEKVETYFQATLLVRPWVVRAQDAVLG